ncbi:hypothetical protein EV421DRAFT_1912763 [Armillaria borealis]|uniref:Uncharacterized protein n=1 Tax=Armillaria borealis TaxID=47425 RepID=A0AA39IVY1_9AGAR|nr:hypothetical protein EV421DRAFT_1912763 [Armillaria borealis]
MFTSSKLSTSINMNHVCTTENRRDSERHPDSCLSPVLWNLNRITSDPPECPPLGQVEYVPHRHARDKPRISHLLWLNNDVNLEVSLAESIHAMPCLHTLELHSLSLTSNIVWKAPLQWTTHISVMDCALSHQTFCVLVAGATSLEHLRVGGASLRMFEENEKLGSGDNCFSKYLRTLHLDLMRLSHSGRSSKTLTIINWLTCIKGPLPLSRLSLRLLPDQGKSASHIMS